VSDLLRDHFPVEVFAPHVDPSPLGRCRAFITTDRIRVYSDRSGKVELVVDEKLEGERPERSRNTLFGQLHVQTEAGMVHLTAARGCGCGSALKALTPPVT